MRKTDTIAAISTPHGVGGVAMLRISGTDALALALKHLSVSALEPRHATHCRFGDIDDGIATYYPIGYTGEPTVEYTCHGSLFVQQALVEALTASGARLAEAGEFTMRAFLNGRLNLSQAEAIADLIEATTPAQHQLAISQLRGGYAKQLTTMRSQMLDLASLLELELDFSDEDVEFADREQLQSLVAEVQAACGRLLASFQAGNALKRGVPVAIVGAPNVGKSTLLNALLGDDRAIVSPIPGTTRDTVEETLTIEGITFRMVDTAGLRHTDDTVEQLGIERSRRAIGEAQIIVHVIDASAPTLTAPLPEGEARKATIVVLNKCDIAAEADIEPTIGDTAIAPPTVRISALTGEGIDSLKQAIRAQVDTSALSAEGSPLLTNLRHRDALMHVQEALHVVAHGLADGTPTDLVAVDLRDALYHLGTITGEVTTDELLGTIFSRFCVGK